MTNLVPHYPVIFLDLNTYGDYFFIEIGPSNGKLKWDWEALDEDFCERKNMISFEVDEIFQYNQSGKNIWNEREMYSSRGCSDKGDLNITSNTTNRGNHPVDDYRTFYELRWQGLVKITYNIKIKK